MTTEQPTPVSIRAVQEQLRLLEGSHADARILQALRLYIRHLELYRAEDILNHCFGCSVLHASRYGAWDCCEAHRALATRSRLLTEEATTLSPRVGNGGHPGSPAWWGQFGINHPVIPKYVP